MKILNKAALKWCVLAGGLSLSTMAQAQSPDPEAPNDSIERGADLMERGTRLLFEGLIEEMGPALGRMRSMTEEMAPVFAMMMAQMGEAFVVLLNTIDSIENYDAPVILDNGDILIPRKPDAPAWEPPADRELKPMPDAEAGIEL